MSQGVAQSARDRAAQRLFAASKDPALVPPRTFTNHSSDKPLKAISMQSPRPEANNNLLHSSLGLGAQIQPRAI